MDVTLAQTFLAIVDCGNFRDAAKRLHVTQSTVSARIKSLEEQLGKPLFVRNKSGATMTVAGRNFRDCALSFVQLWDKARYKVASTRSYQDYFRIGVRPSLWHPLTMNWLQRVQRQFPAVAFHLHFGIASDLVRKMQEGVLDIAVLLTAPSLPGIEAEKLYREDFLLVSGCDDPVPSPERADEFAARYIDIEWGEEFRSNRDHYYPYLSVAGLTFSMGSYGLQYLLRNGGYGYFPRTMVQADLDRKALKVVNEAPVISQQIYLAHARNVDNVFLPDLLNHFRALAKEV
ncbi:LysR family transcriptional regulator [Emcibacter nanhaiensis]|uniref:LysR family transcriptional regulator n=1 Tax=Emcibacter nanhaiensis TaxID=1505037 RepID=A0A501PD42_9PROT|nr:LysR family transcriptional regulator [Emcibacter nanhaiensis]